MKAFFLTTFALALVSGLCACVGPGLTGTLTREQAIRLYAGGIDESDWLAALDTIPRPLPGGHNAVQLTDGFLFYETELCDGKRRVTDVIPPADAPAALKELARSLRPERAPAQKLVVSENGLIFNGNAIDEETLAAEIKRLAALPEKSRPEIEIRVEENVRAMRLERIRKLFSDESLAPALHFEP